MKHCFKENRNEFNQSETVEQFWQTWLDFGDCSKHSIGWRTTRCRLLIAYWLSDWSYLRIHAWKIRCVIRKTFLGHMESDQTPNPMFAVWLCSLSPTIMTHVLFLFHGLSIFNSSLKSVACKITQIIDFSTLCWSCPQMGTTVNISTPAGFPILIGVPKTVQFKIRQKL